MTRTHSALKAGGLMPKIGSLLALSLLSTAVMVMAQTTINTSAGNGLTSTEGATINGSSTTETFFADSGYWRWRMNINHSINSPQIVAAWPCNSAGCIPFAGTGVSAGTGVTIYPETPLSIPATNPTNMFLQIGSSSLPTWVASPTVGIAGTVQGQITFASSTSGGSITLAPVSTASSAFTLTLPATTSTLATLNTSGLANYQTTTAAQAAYSGIGTCTGSRWVSGVNANAAPTCTQPSASDLSNTVTGTVGTAVVLATGPSLTNPTVNTQTAGDNSTKAASTAYVDRVAQGTILVSFCSSTVGTGNSTTYGLMPAATVSTTCNSTSVTELPMPYGCTVKNLYVTSSAAGLNSNSGNVQFYKNGNPAGSPSTLGCKLGTSVTLKCNDTTDSVSVSAGDTWSVRVTTGAASDTTANIRAAFQCL